MKSIILIAAVSMLLTGNVIKLRTEFPNINTSNKNEYMVLPSCFVETADKYYVSDGVESKVLVFEKKSGKYIMTIGRKGKGPGDLMDPFVMCVHPIDGSLYVAERGNSRISIFTVKGKYIRSFVTVGTIRSMYFVDQKLCTMAFDLKKGFVFNIYENDKILVKGGGINKEDYVQNKYVFDAMYGLSNSYFINKKIYAYSRYVPKVYVYDSNGVLLNTIELKSAKMKDIYEKNRNAKVDKNTGIIYVEHPFDNLVMNKEKIFTFDNKRKVITAYNYSGEKTEEMQMDAKKEDIYRLCGITNEGFAFFSPNSSIQIFK